MESIQKPRTHTDEAPGATPPAFKRPRRPRSPRLSLAIVLAALTFNALPLPGSPPLAAAVDPEPLLCMILEPVEQTVNEGTSAHIDVDASCSTDDDTPPEKLDFKFVAVSDDDEPIVEQKEYGRDATLKVDTPKVGKHRMFLYVRDAQDHVSMLQRNFTVRERSTLPPEACFTIPDSIYAGRMFQTDASCSTYEAGNARLRYSWKWLPGDDFSAPGTDHAASHAFAEAGDYPITLFVTDAQGRDDGNHQRVTKTAHVLPDTNESPTACFTLTPPEVPAGDDVVLDASCSTDDGGFPGLRFLWYVDDEPLDEGTAQVTHTFTQPRVSTVSLHVWDSEAPYKWDGVSHALQVTPSSSNPGLVACIWKEGNGPFVGHNTIFTTECSNRNGYLGFQEIETRWQVDGGELSPWGRDQSIGVTPTSTGPLPITLWLRDPGGSVDSVTQSWDVAPASEAPIGDQPPKACARLPRTMYRPSETITVTSCSTDAEGPVSIHWWYDTDAVRYWHDSVGTGSTHSVTETEPGTHFFEIQATDSHPQSSYSRVDFTVGDFPTWVDSCISASSPTGEYVDADGVAWLLVEPNEATTFQRCQEVAGYDVRWDFNDDGAFDTAWSRNASGTFTFTKSGKVHAVLQVSHPDWGNVPVRLRLLVMDENRAPNACFDVVNEWTYAGNPLQVDASCSTDDRSHLGQTLVYRWTWSGASAWTEWSGSPLKSITFTTGGVKTIQLEVKDATGLTDDASRDIVLPQLLGDDAFIEEWPGCRSPDTSASWKGEHCQAASLGWTESFAATTGPTPSSVAHYFTIDYGSFNRHGQVKCVEECGFWLKWQANVTGWAPLEPDYQGTVGVAYLERRAGDDWIPVEGGQMNGRITFTGDEYELEIDDQAFVSAEGLASEVGVVEYRWVPMLIPWADDYVNGVRWSVRPEAVQAQLVAAPLVLVHGWKREADLAEDKYIFKASWADEFLADLDENAEAWFGQDPYAWTTEDRAIVNVKYHAKQDLRVSAAELHAAIEDNRTRFGFSGPVDIVGHSMGGLVARWMLEEWLPMLQENQTQPPDSVADADRYAPLAVASNLVTIGTPHDGAFQAWPWIKFLEKSHRFYDPVPCCTHGFYIDQSGFNVIVESPLLRGYGASYVRPWWTPEVGAYRNWVIADFQGVEPAGMPIMADWELTPFNPILRSLNDEFDEGRVPYYFLAGDRDLTSWSAWRGGNFWDSTITVLASGFNDKGDGTVGTWSATHHHEEQACWNTLHGGTYYHTNLPKKNAFVWRSLGFLAGTPTDLCDAAVEPFPEPSEADGGEPSLLGPSSSSSAFSSGSTATPQPSPEDTRQPIAIAESHASGPDGWRAEYRMEVHDANSFTATLVTNATETGAEVQLRGPSGASSPWGGSWPPGASWFEETDDLGLLHQTVTVPYPIPGNWTFTVMDGNTSHLPPFAGAFVEGTFNVDDLSDREAMLGEPVVFRVALDESSSMLDNVSARVLVPEGESGLHSTIGLRDDGAWPDDVEGDGIHSGSLLSAKHGDIGYLVEVSSADGFRRVFPGSVTLFAKENEWELSCAQIVAQMDPLYLALMLANNPFFAADCALPDTPESPSMTRGVCGQWWPALTPAPTGYEIPNPSSITPYLTATPTPLPSPSPNPTSFLNPWPPSPTVPAPPTLTPPKPLPTDIIETWSTSSTTQPPTLPPIPTLTIPTPTIEGCI